MKKRSIRTVMIVFFFLISFIGIFASYITTFRQVSCYDSQKTKVIVLYNSVTKIGFYRSYFETGELSSRYFLRRGKIIGKAIEYYKNGRKKAVQEYEHGLEHGLFTEYFPDGSVKRQYSSIYGMAQGPCVEYYSQGTVYREYTYIDGRIEGDLTIFRESGERKAICKLFQDSVYYKKIYQFDGVGSVIDSQVMIFPLISIDFDSEMNRAVSSVELIIRDIPFVRDSFYLNFDMAIRDPKIGLFPPPEILRSFKTSDVLRDTFTIEEGLSADIALYGVLQYHDPTGGIIEFEDFVVPVIR